MGMTLLAMVRKRRAEAVSEVATDTMVLALLEERMVSGEQNILVLKDVVDEEVLEGRLLTRIVKVFEGFWGIQLK